MGALSRIVLVCFIAWLSFQFVVILRHLNRLGVGTHTFNHAPGPCHVFHVNGSEDIDVLPNGLAIFTSGLKYSIDGISDPFMMTRTGKMYSFDFHNPDQTPKEITLQNFDKSDFNPLGQDVYIDPSTKDVLVFVVNRGRTSTIEIFQFDQDNLVLKHKRTVQHEVIYNANDVVATGPESFYVTIDFYFINPLLKQIETGYPFHLASIAFYDGKTAKIVANNMAFANGIDMDKSGRYVYAVSGSDNSIFVFERNADNTLDKRQEIFIGHILDNVKVIEETGDVLTAGLSHGLAYQEYNKNFSKPCASKVFLVKLNEKTNGETPYEVDDIIEAHATTGTGDFKCASTAVSYKGNLLIGSIFENLMYCKVLAL